MGFDRRAALSGLLVLGGLTSAARAASARGAAAPATSQGREIMLVVQKSGPSHAVDTAIADHLTSLGHPVRIAGDRAFRIANRPAHGAGFFQQALETAFFSGRFGNGATGNPMDRAGARSKNSVPMPEPL